MSLYEKIFEDMREAYREKKSKVGVLKYIISEFDRRSNLTVKPTDSEVIATIRKYIKSIDENCSSLGIEKTSEQLAEIVVLSEYLPQMATEDEIRSWITDNIKDLPEQPQKRLRYMRDIMTAFKDRVDGNTVRKVLQEI